MSSPAAARAGLVFALAAHTVWGLFPIYWKLLGHVPAMEVLAHRILWSVGFTATVLWLSGQLREVARALRSPALRRALLLSTAMIAINWYLFIWAVSTDRVTEASLGYYINPLLNAVLARVVLGERLARLQVLSLLLAAGAVAYLTLSSGSLPWVSVVLAVTFALYGLIRKRAQVGALVGLTVETGLAAPAALLYLAMLRPPLGHLLTADFSTRALLLGAGVATALPLLAFAAAATRLRLTTLGMVQYLAPTLQLGCAVLLYGEPFRREHAVTFSLIWLAIALYVVGARRPAPTPAPV